MTMTRKILEDWQISVEERSELEALPTPSEFAVDMTAKDITYPHCNDWPTGRRCPPNAEIGTIWEHRCVNENGTTTSRFTCEYD